MKIKASQILTPISNIILTVFVLGVFFMGNAVGQTNGKGQTFSKVSTLEKTSNSSFAPRNIFPVDEWLNDYPEFINVSGDVIFYREDGNLIASDYSDPLNPVILLNMHFFDSYDDLGEVSLVKDAFLFITDDNYTIFVFDISDINNIVFKSTIESKRNYSAHKSLVLLQFEDNILYTNSYEPGNAHIFAYDLSDASNPIHVGEYENYKRMSSFVISNKTVYYFMEESMYAVDFADPANPVDLSTYSVERFSVLGAVKDNYIYLNQNRTGIHVFDISDANNPVQVNYIVNESPIYGEVFIVGDFLFMRTLSKVLIYSIADPITPTYIASILVSSGLKITNGKAYYDGENGGFKILDISDPQHPEYIQTAPLNYSAGMKYVGMNNGYVFGTTEVNLVKVFSYDDISTPVNFIQSENSINNSVIYANYMYQDDVANIYLTDISDPLNPVFEGIIHEKDSVLNTAVEIANGKMFYTAFDRTDYSFTLNYFDLSNMDKGAYYKKFGRDVFPSGHFFKDEKLYTFDEARAYKVIDLVTGENLSSGNLEISKYGSDPFEVLNHNSQIYITDGDLITIYNINDLNDIVKIAEINTTPDRIPSALSDTFINKIWMEDNYLYVLYGHDFLVYDMIIPNWIFCAGAYSFDSGITSISTKDDHMIVSTENTGNFLLIGYFQSRGTSIAPFISDFTLHYNSPNPFNPETLIKYSLYKPGHVTLEIFTKLGQKVKTLVDTDQNKGIYFKKWNGTNISGGRVASGVYFYRLTVDGTVSTKRMLLIK